MSVFIRLLDFSLREMQSSTLTLQKSPPTPRYGLTPFCRNERPTLPTLPTSFGLLVSSAKSTISLRGRISSASPPGRTSLTPSPTSARFGPSTTPPNTAHLLRETMTDLEELEEAQ